MAKSHGIGLAPLSTSELLGGTVKAYSQRMRVYFSEMFPIPQHTALALLTYLSIAVFARWLEKQSSPIASWYTLLGVISVFGLWLILRLMDELKDADIDRKLFPDRPLPSGRVSAADIKITLAGAILLYLLAHLPAGPAFWTALLVLGYAALMFKRFFAEELLRKSLIITLVTHNPIVAWMLTQCFVIFAAEHGLELHELRWNLIMPFIIMLWSPLLAWEMARKIRCAEEETDYVTYSRLFGRVGAVVLTAGIQTIALGIGIFFWDRFSLSWIYVAILFFGWGLNFLGDVRFVLHPNRRTAKLKYYAVAFLLCVEIAQLVEFGWLART
jgi:4-hydroxybenzoate polyprenyltransferase